ncbi:MAG: hypothetical protein J6V73_07110 [Spirochaetaceae bacterium]|nr:hypothetical protein [Spirochaetaceae bacterium]
MIVKKMLYIAGKISAKEQNQLLSAAEKDQMQSGNGRYFTKLEIELFNFSVLYLKNENLSN